MPRLPWLITRHRVRRLKIKGGIDGAVAQVGACSRTDCRHNADLECTADAVRVGAGADGMAANCLTYEPA